MTPTVLQEIDQKFHLVLLTARLLLQNSAATERVHRVTGQLADSLGIEARLLVSYEAITLTTKIHNQFYSRISTPIPAMKINMMVMTQVMRLVDDIQQGHKTLEEVTDELELINHHAPHHYPQWFLVLMLGIAGGSLAKIFHGDWSTFLIVSLATALGLILRQQLAKHKFNGFIITFFAAFLGGCISAIGIKLGWTTTPEPCLLVPSMMLVPGVHLINAVLDMVYNHQITGIARLNFSLVMLISILFGLLLSGSLMDISVAVNSTKPPLLQPENILFAGFVAAGFAILFNVPKGILWVCILCGIVGYGMRFFSIYIGLGIIWGNLLASMVVGLMTVYFSRRFKVPSAAIAFGAVVGMIPGIFMFRAGSGLILMMKLGINSDISLIANTIVMAGTALLMTLGIPVGLALPNLLFFRSDD
ncbi:threonine/serine exporter family protein [Planktothrix mougeotii]|uniref:Threonine/serine exporter family protein n=1 Tax=Planktothrix mougeotii LEGE 06226 TaxID=1828728 RepID=A0ABR9U6Z7_9CYAN|nr:threonine/serine exporter family protein [Planktothrix mougeotii]MBE9142230.1 threonine/serine exporter family protein [Planktothrix mougeotii LEGE 06226]